MTAGMPFYHGTYSHHPMGTVWSGRGDSYHDEWSVLSHYEALHANAPEGAIAHRDAVFMCDKIDDIDTCGGATMVVALMRPIGPVTRHDICWTGHISLLLDEGRGIDDPEVVAACHGYWVGTPMGTTPIWEYITTRAEVLACCDYDDPDAEDILLAFMDGAAPAGMAP